MAKRAPRLQFTEEERASPELAPAIQKADKQIKKLEKAEAKVPKKEVKQRVVDSDGKITTRLSFEEKKPPSKLSHAAKVSGDTVLHGVHRKVQQSNDGDNAGVDAANTLTESTIENLVIAKGYTDCVAFVNGESVSVVIAGTDNGLENSDIAKVTDIVMEETGLTADKIKIMEAN